MLSDPMADAARAGMPAGVSGRIPGFSVQVFGPTLDLTAAFPD